MNTARDSRVDAYIAEAGPFARPILTHLRELVHTAVPGATETIKWHMPFFEHGGAILCYMAAFKAHCGFGFWHRGMKAVVGQARAKAGEGMGYFGRVVRRADLPSDAAMRRFLKAAAKLNEEKRSKPKGKARAGSASRARK